MKNLEKPEKNAGSFSVEIIPIVLDNLLKDNSKVDSVMAENMVVWDLKKSSVEEKQLWYFLSFVKDVFDYKYEIQNTTVNGHCNEVSQWLRKAGGNLHLSYKKNELDLIKTQITLH